MEIKRIKILITLSMIIVLILGFQKCSLYSPTDASVLNNKIIYDSINYKGKGFRVNLYTTLEFSESIIKRNDYNDFLLIVNKDTFPLVPEVNYLKMKSQSDIIQVKYFSQINFQSKVFSNDSIFNIIKTSSKIINSKGKEIDKKETYNIESFITLHLPNKNGGIKF